MGCCETTPMDGQTTHPERDSARTPIDSITPGRPDIEQMKRQELAEAHARAAKMIDTPAAK